jgi:ribosomal protein L16 Arg81 hydroxylase
MATVERPALSTLVSPRSLTEFDEHWPDKTFVIQGETARLPEFLRARELSNIGTLASVYRGRLAFCSGAKTSYLVPGDVSYAQKLFRMGLTLYFDDVAPYVPEAQAFLEQLESDLGIAAGSTRLTVWASPREDGAACHYDANDVVSIQLYGTKRFELAPVREISVPYGMQYSPGTIPFDDLYTQTGSGFPDWQTAEFSTTEMKPGSVLFFPRGTWHRTFVNQDSLAVAIVIEPPPAINCLLDELRLVLLQDPRWRKPLYGAWGNGSQREHALARAEELLRELPQAMSTLSPQDLILPSLTQEQRFELIDERTRFQRVPNTSVSAEPEGENQDALQWIRINFKDEHGLQHTLASVETPRQYADIIGWLAEQETPFSVQALQSRFPATPFAEVKRLLQVCTRGGLLKPLWFPAIDTKRAP